MCGLKMVNPVTVGVAALLIFVTLSQSAPVEPGDEDIAKIVHQFVCLRSRTIKAGITAPTICTGLAAAVRKKELTPLILEKVNTIVGASLPGHSSCTIAQILNPSGFQNLRSDQTRIARLMAFSSTQHGCAHRLTSTNLV
ncbi:hypothetical protein SeMB42_g04084 [Synchytrium endobioticum]|uniref:Uncharacterized protein n=1 Tax=Synchytrium endobioticum TaxID=286115 RepID=A0A507D1A6_9FUNG|nr:hypothetical protein SeMB42_g04084 [Synchytrium endobioticum]